MIPQVVKCLLGFHAWLPWRWRLQGVQSRVCGTCGKVQRRTR